MANWCPPYISKHTERLEKELAKAKAKELKAKKGYEYAVEYTKLCTEQLEKAKSNENK